MARKKKKKKKGKRSRRTTVARKKGDKKKSAPKKKRTRKSSPGRKAKGAKAARVPEARRALPDHLEDLLADCPDPGNPKEVRRTVRKALALEERGKGKGLDQDELWLLRFLIAESYWGQGHLRRAQREYLRLAESNPRDALSMLRLGLIAELLSESTIARQHYQQALAVASKEHRDDTRVAFARFLRRQGEYQEALRLLKIATKSEGARGPAAAEGAYVESLFKGYDPAPLHGWRKALQALAGDDPVFSYFLANYDLWCGRQLQGLRRLRAFIARLETAAPPLANTLHFEAEHARRILVRIESAHSVQMP